MAIQYESEGRQVRMNDIRCMSVAEVADRLSISQRQIARLIARGELPSLKAGRRRLIQRDAVAAWLDGKVA